jgi:Holliday junction DNA helicase RuvA
MIAFLRGEIAGISSGGVVIDVGGVGYRVAMSTLSIATLGERGSEVTIFTLMICRDESIALYGFTSQPEQQLFEKLITVSGVGPKVALSALSAFQAATLSQLIRDEDVLRIATIPGIGKKTAQRIILELRGSLREVDDQPTANLSGATGASTQATEALLGMGFTSAEAELALKGYDGASDDVSALIRYGLKRLGG